MSIATEKVKLATERFVLIRMNPARYILPVLNAGLYEITLPIILNKIERNGILLTKVSSTPSTNDEWYQDESTGLLQVKLASAPNDTTNILIAYYYLFYTGTIFRAISEDPEDDATPIREWQPRIQSYPSFLQSIDNIISGVFTINDTDITLINADKDFQNYLTDDDSFFNKEIDVWLCINDVSNIQKIFKGAIKKVVGNQNTITISCTDVFNKFKSKATMGDSLDEIYFTEAGFPDVLQKDKDKPCPFILGNFSRWLTLKREDFSSLGTPDDYIFSEGNEAVCVSTDVVSTTTNRIWGCCRQHGDLKMQSIGTIDATANISGAHGIKLSSYSNLYVGDTFKFNNGVDQYATIVHVGAFTFMANPYDIIIDLTTAAPAPGDTAIASPSFCVIVVDPSNNLPNTLYYGRDFTVSTTVTSGGNNYVEVTLTNNFEASFTFGDLDPNAHKIMYRTSSDDPRTHAEVIQEICDLVGIATDPVSFAAADAALNVYVQFGIPNFDEQDYDIYLKYVQDILSSTLGFLKINSDLEVEYNLLEAPVSTLVRDKFLTINEQTGTDIEYQDIITQLIAFNPHNSSFQVTSTTPSPSETREKPKSKYLHGIDNVVRFRHVLETITDRIDDHMNLKSERFAKYKFGTATEDVDSEINTDLQFENDIILGTTKVKDVKVLTIEKSPKQTNMEVSDLKGL